MATIKDIAQMTGVSPTTVANVIHGRTSKVSEETQKKVKQALAETNYTAHMGGRLLAKHGSKIIGVIIQDSTAVSDHIYDNPYQGEFLQAVEQSIGEAGYFMMFRRISTIEEGLRLVEMWNLEGLILSGSHSSEVKKWREKIQVPIVFLDMYTEYTPLAQMNVGIEDYIGGRLAGEYLVEMGHEKVAFVAQGEVAKGIEGLDQVRGKGFQDVFKEHQLKADILCVPALRGPYHNYLEQFVEQMLLNYTALFFSSDLLAVQAISHFYQHGLRLPKDLSIVSFDGTLLSQYATPRLTVIQQDVTKKALAAIELLIQAIKKNTTELKSVSIPVKLVVRESVCRIEKN
ncbi:MULTISPECIES: LacI family DNA-binding transcriptional regulator [Enterococcus]|uniref:HTH lacI-type domain-containing protein n=1 Tax=Enterococcus sulfureus ATCC 49903 TaxID=1140003 RepID=S0PFK5_9ENTE|nr:LacI family DNA-binding transcriptional regulator [Enterococcus sulfureus]EOT49561.1 hypothetical protein OMY_00489 [Enterococcus sulfureus ATCC 49903]EOT87428.1 hypothetical protein I573_00484 [Enterococcus sulfureus ATCC 49903]